MRFGSLFSGIGGLDLGLERAGMECAWQVENDPYCQRVLKNHWPAVPLWGDIRELTGAELAPVDLICGGFPCQPLSRAGRRRGADDEKWLWPEYARIVRALRPNYVLVENVATLLTRGIEPVVGFLAACGYDAEWDCLPAAAFGAPHIRDRLYLLAYPRGRRHGASHETVFAGWTSSQLHGGWANEPDVGRVAHGLPDGVDRRRVLGNAVVPRVAEWIGRRIMTANGEQNAGDAR